VQSVATAKDLPINTIITCNAEFDSTVFSRAQNKPNATDATAGAVLSADASPAVGGSDRNPRAEKIQSICNGKSTPSAM
jgi:hypothetical protein